LRCPRTYLCNFSAGLKRAVCGGDHDPAATVIDQQHVFGMMHTIFGREFHLAFATAPDSADGSTIYRKVGLIAGFVSVPVLGVIIICDANLQWIIVGFDSAPDITNGCDIGWVISRRHFFYSQHI
jgi:hypothetical protein